MKCIDIMTIDRVFVTYSEVLLVTVRPYVLVTLGGIRTEADRVSEVISRIHNQVQRIDVHTGVA